MVDNYQRQKFIENGIAKLLNDANRDDFTGQPEESDLLNNILSDLTPQQRETLTNSLIQSQHAEAQSALRAQYDVEFAKLVAQYRGQGNVATTALTALKQKYRRYGLEGV